MKIFSAAFLLLLPWLDGCAFIEAHAGYYGASHTGGDRPEAQLTGVRGGLGYGFRAGVYLDFPRDNERIRVALGAGDGAFRGSSDQGAVAVGAAGVEARADVTVAELADYRRLRATGIFFPASGGKYRPPGSSSTYDNKGSLGFLLGATYMSGDRDGSWGATVGYRRIAISKLQRNEQTPQGDNGINAGEFIFQGVELQVMGSKNLLTLFSDEPRQRRETVLTLVPRFEQPVSSGGDLLDAFESGARKLGCEVYLPSSRVIARCAGFSVGLRQEGNKVSFLCMPGTSEQDCKQLVGRVAHREKEDLVEGYKLEARWDKTLSEETDVLAPFEAGAKRASCKTTRQGGRLTAACPQGVVGIEQKGAKVTFLCEPNLSTEDCKALVQQVLKAAKEAP